MELPSVYKWVLVKIRENGGTVTEKNGVRFNTIEELERLGFAKVSDKGFNELSRRTFSASITPKGEKTIENVKR